MRKLKSDNWHIKFTEFDKPVWIIVGVIPTEEYGEFEVLLGMCSASTRERALESVDSNEYAFLEAYEIMSVMSQAHMMSQVADIIDNIDLD